MAKERRWKEARAKEREHLAAKKKAQQKQIPPLQQKVAAKEGENEPDSPLSPTEVQLYLPVTMRIPSRRRKKERKKERERERERERKRERKKEKERERKRKKEKE